jgi:hypothetical protein
LSIRWKVALFTGALLRPFPMRPAAILTLSVSFALASCASPTPSSDWQANQRSRLARSHEQRTLAEVLADVITRSPRTAHELPADAPIANSTKDRVAERNGPEPSRAYEAAAKLRRQTAQGPGSEQDPGHIDQRLPERAGVGPRSFRHRWQPLEATLNYGVGDIMVRADGTRLNDRTDAVFARAQLDGRHGAALTAEWWDSDANLFAGQFMNDGVVPKVANAELGGIDLFPHIRFDHQHGDWSVPVRFGLFADWQQLDHQQARVEREWLSFGPRILVEPTWTMLRSDKGSLNLFARIGGDIGAAWFSEEFRNGDDKDMTTRWAGEIGGGLRGAYGRWHAELGYRLHHTTIGESQGDLLGSPGRTELQRQQVFFGLGYSY